jgi:hypothetical protein
MAYRLESSLKDRDNLDYEFEGGIPGLATDNLKDQDGRPIKGADLMGCFMSSRRVPSELMPAIPTRLVVRPASDGFIPDFGMAATLGGRLVSDRFVALVERLEPNRHQFIPLEECVDRKGRPLGRAFFLMNVLTRLEAIDVERSDVSWETIRFADQTEATMLVPKGYMNLKLVLRRQVIQGHHVWRGGRNGLIGFYFISDDLHESMKEAKLSALRLTKCEES